MSEIITLLKYAGVETRSCPRCGALMRLVGIEPHHLPTSRDEIYTFECDGCGITTVAEVSKTRLRRQGDWSVTS
jgi:hypothetical protein